MINKSCVNIFVFISLAVIFLFSCNDKKNDQRPNIIVILADDMGYSDLGCTGSEIATPNLDKMAAEGVMFTHCYNASRCCPSRASLLTGLYQHEAGVGHMNDDLGYPAYRGYLNEQCVTIAEVLKGADYHTYMVGKWHIGDAREHWPDKRGFEQFYGVPKGGGLYFFPSRFIDRQVYKNGIEETPDSTTFYSTNNFTDEAIGFIKNQSDQKPFFLYLAYIAPHFPLQALPEDIAKYKDVYRQGYDSIRKSRYKKELQLGLIDPNTKISPSDYPYWDSVKNIAEESRKMAVYAAQVDRMDQNIGRLFQALSEMNKLDNTMVLFLSDNGACAEKVNRSPGKRIGTAQSFVSYGKNWANVSNTPYRLYKSMEHEGGIITPLIVYWPKEIRTGGRLIGEPVHIIDIMPTCLALGNASYPEKFKGNKILPMEGRSFLPLLHKTKNAGRRELFWEHQGNKAVRQGDWKLVKLHAHPWELYNLNQDPTELNDLVDQKIVIKDKLLSDYEQWMLKNGVREWPVKSAKDEK